MLIREAAAAFLRLDLAAYLVELHSGLLHTRLRFEALPLCGWHVQHERMQNTGPNGFGPCYMSSWCHALALDHSPHTLWSACCTHRVTAQAIDFNTVPPLIIPRNVKI
jgi:hypothetical protein